jgi:uncharacterized protein YjbI with pentapeptide repeats
MAGRAIQDVLSDHSDWLQNSGHGQRAILINTDLSNIDLQGADLREVNFAGSNLAGADFSGANLSHSNMFNVDLQSALLKGTDLTEVDRGYYSCGNLVDKFEGQQSSAGNIT